MITNAIQIYLMERAQLANTVPIAIGTYIRTNS